MVKHRPPTKRNILVVGSVLLVVLAGLYLARGWIRGSVVPAYAKIFYKPKVETAFKNDLAPINQRLKAYGLVFSIVGQNECWSGGNALFQGFSETVPCIKLMDSNQITPSDSYIANWRATSPQLEQYLLANGWHKEYFAAQPIGTIFDVPNYTGTIQVNYSNSHGKLVCDLSISYNPHSQTWATESCEKDLVLFGGSSG